LRLCPVLIALSIADCHSSRDYDTSKAVVLCAKHQCSIETRICETTTVCATSVQVTTISNNWIKFDLWKLDYGELCTYMYKTWPHAKQHVVSVTAVPHIERPTHSNTQQFMHTNSHRSHDSYACPRTTPATSSQVIWFYQWWVTCRGSLSNNSVLESPQPSAWTSCRLCHPCGCLPGHTQIHDPSNHQTPVLKRDRSLVNRVIRHVLVSTICKIIIGLTADQTSTQSQQCHNKWTKHQTALLHAGYCIEGCTNTGHGQECFYTHMKLKV